MADEEASNRRHKTLDPEEDLSIRRGRGPFVRLVEPLDCPPTNTCTEGNH